MKRHTRGRSRSRSSKGGSGSVFAHSASTKKTVTLIVPKSTKKSLKTEPKPVFTKHKQLSGSSGYIGEIRGISSKDLVKVLGKPSYINKHSEDYKTRYNWVLKDSKGKVLQIYDWKEYDTPISKVRTWNIGGDKEALKSLKKMFPNAKNYVVRT